MGLREKKAQQNRERIVREALILFARNGYEQTTMESIAEAAGLSPSTLYRCFPSKDLILLDRFNAFGEQFSRVFAGHSAHHPVDEALAQAIFAVLSVEDENPSDTLLVRSIIDQAPIARARLWDYLAAQQRQLSRVIAVRLRAKPTDLRVVFTAQLAILISAIAADVWRANKGKPPSRAIAADLMRLLQQGSIVFPRPPAKPAKPSRPAKRRAPRK
jgi:AcrR family transcriptional regulator